MTIHVVMATCGAGDDVEAEPVLVDADRQGVWLTLDDGEVIAFDRAELLDAISLPATASQAAA